MPTFTVAFKDALEMDPSIESGVLAEYPIFSEDYRGWLNQQIKDQFWNREIGQETISMFKLALKRKLNQIMPLYNQHYLASQIKIDPLQTMSIKNVLHSSGDTTSSGNSTSESDSGSKSAGVATDYPQSGRTEGGKYATSGQESESESTAKSEAVESSAVNQREARDAETTGSSGHAAMLLFQYRQTLVNVDAMVLEELESLFFMLWSNGDEFTNRSMAHGYNRFGLSL